MKKHPHDQRGFSLLFAAIIATIVLSIGTAIFDIAIKQVELSSASQQSQYAFYAADTAANCALYWDERSDIHPNTFATSSSDTNSATSLTCDGQTVKISVLSSPPPTPTSASTQFQFAPNSYCATVIVMKNAIVGENGTAFASTTIQANGYNTPCAGISGSTALQRTVQLNY